MSRMVALTIIIIIVFIFYFFFFLFFLVLFVTKDHICEQVLRLLGFAEFGF